MKTMQCVVYVVAAIALAGCMTPQSRYASGQTWPAPAASYDRAGPAACGPGSKEKRRCEVKVELVNGLPTPSIEVLHVFFGGKEGSVPIVWTLSDDVARLNTGFRRGSGVIFDNLEPLQDVLSADRLEQPLGDKVISTSVKVDDVCRKGACEGAYRYRLIVYDRDGIARIGRDPIVKNHLD